MGETKSGPKPGDPKGSAKSRVVRPDLGGPFPEHIAIIMDGNGRWAEERGLRRVFGHREGIDSVREVTTECARMGVGSLTLYAFSVENWKRPRAEVLAELRRSEELTRANRGMRLRLALSYGARSELADGVRALARDVQRGALDPARIDEETLRSYLYDPETPDPDLLIRTAGELRLSNFLLWQASYSEIHVSDVCWPEFRKPALLAAMRDYAGRVRKFGGLISDRPPEPAPLETPPATPAARRAAP